MDTYSVRDVTFVVFQFFVAASFQVVTQAQRLALLLTLLAATLVSFVVTAWTPTIFSALFLPFFIGALPGTLLGEFLVSVFDRFTSYHAPSPGDPAAGATPVLMDPGRGIGCMRSIDVPRFAPATLFVAVLVLLPLFVLPLAISDDNLPWAIYLFAALATLVYAGAGLLVRRVSHPYSRAWLILSILTGINYVVMLSFITFTTTFWAYLVYVTCIVLDAVVVLSIAPCASGDVQAALSTITSSMTAPASAAPVPVSAMPALSSSNTNYTRPQYTVAGSSVALGNGRGGDEGATISIPLGNSAAPGSTYMLTPEQDTAPASDNKLFDFFSIGRK
jgi:hypothetical protein